MATAEAISRQRALHRRPRLLWLRRITPVTFGAACGIVLFVFLALFARVLAPYDPTAIHRTAILEPPSSQFWFGTDDLGRDVFSRILYGLQNSLLIANLGLLLGTVVGSLLGLLSAYAGGVLDFLLQRFAEILSALPALVVAIVMVAVLGPGIWKIALAIALALLPSYIRFTRGVALRVKSAAYFEAARALGAGHLRIMFRHLLPNCLGAIVVLAAANFGIAVLAEAGLSFLGLGLAPPAPSLGGMLSGSLQRYFYQAPWMAIFPGLTLSLLILCTNLVADAVRDYLDPRSRWRI